MALTTPSRSMSLAALTLSAAVGVQADGMTFVRPCPMSRLGGRQMEVHQNCDADIANLCTRPQSNPLDALFGGGPFGGGSGSSIGGPPMSSSPFPSDPVFRSVFESDPFFRMVTTPPGLRSSPGILDEFFGGGDVAAGPFRVQQPRQQRESRREQVETVSPLSSLLDEMMDSAMRFALDPPSGVSTVRVVHFGPGGMEVEEEVEASPPQESQLMEDTPPAAVAESGSREAEPADVAEVALERIVNSFLGHTVSAASAATAASAGSGDEAADVDYLPAEDSEDTDDEDAEAVVDEDPPIEETYGRGGFDPVSFARQISEHGKEILKEEDDKAAASAAAASDDDASDPDPELRRRRRLSEEHPEMRRRLARRLTEVGPFMGMPAHIQLVPFGNDNFDDNTVVRFFVQSPFEEQPQQPPARRTAEELRPRLLLGRDVDLCLWDLHDAGGDRLSENCATSLAQTRETFADILKEEEDREREAAAAANAALRNFLRGVDGGDGDAQPQAMTYGEAVWDALVSSRFLLVAVWCFFFLLALQACFNEGDDDDDANEYYYYYEDEGEGNPEDYVALADDDDDGADGDVAQVDNKSDYPAARNAAAKVRQQVGGGVVYVGVPIDETNLQVV